VLSGYKKVESVIIGHFRMTGKLTLNRVDRDEDALPERLALELRKSHRNVAQLVIIFFVNVQRRRLSYRSVPHSPASLAYDGEGIRTPLVITHRLRTRLGGALMCALGNVCNKGNKTRETRLLDAPLFKPPRDDVPRYRRSRDRLLLDRGRRH